MSPLSPLQSGDIVRLVSPASPLPATELVFLTELLASAGYQVQVADHALEETAYFAGSDEIRAKDLTDAFSDPEVKAVICTRGGYGCARLFPFLDLDFLARNRKFFSGFSDITTLHVALNQRGLPTLHAPMAKTLHFPRDPWVYESFLAGFKGGNPVPEEAPRATMLAPGIATGIVTGGCLLLICDSLGTPEEIDTKGKILVLEDVDEPPHRVDAMLTHLINAGKLQACAGIAVGQMTRTELRSDPTIGKKPWREIMLDRLGPLGIPVVLDLPFGHMPNMLTLPLGVTATLNANAGMLQYRESLCGLLP